MEQIYITDFKNVAFDILKKYSGLPLNLMISGGSLLKILDNPMYKELDTEQWKIYYTDERLTHDISYRNIIQSHCFTQHTKAKIIAMDLEAYNVNIDICMMGISEDGHIASIFPNSKTLYSDKIIVKIDNSPKPPPNRVTVTPKFLNTVDRLYFFVPPTENGIKDVKHPHESIMEKLNRPFTVYLYKNN